MEVKNEMSATYFIKGRPWRHGYRVEGSYVLKKLGVYHKFFKSEKEALDAITKKDL